MLNIKRHIFEFLEKYVFSLEFPFGEVEWKVKTWHWISGGSMNLGDVLEGINLWIFKLNSFLSDFMALKSCIGNLYLKSGICRGPNTNLLKSQV